MSTRKMWLLAVAVLAVVALAVAVPVARADTFQLTTGNSPGLDGFSGPYATITLTQGTNEVTVSITTDAFTGGQYFIGDGSTFAFNSDLTLTSSNFGSFSWTGGNATTAFSFGGSGQVDSWGVFTDTINDFDGATRAVTALSFVISYPGITLADLEFVNTNGNEFAGHIFACDTADIVSGSCTLAAATGFATGTSGTPPTIPEPATLMTLGSGLLALGGFFRRRLGIGG
jgi:PEP-CTERM motif